MISDEVFTFLDEVSDEIGEYDLGQGYLLKYEGWSGSCVEDVWSKVEAKQKKRGIDILSEEAEEERENACCEFAEGQGHKIIRDEWTPELKGRSYNLIDRGYDSGGLYGRTWALFRRVNLIKQR